MNKQIVKYETDSKYFKKDRVYLLKIKEHDIVVEAIDLTLMFGKGNEPTDVDDERLKEIEYKEYKG